MSELYKEYRLWRVGFWASAAFILAFAISIPATYAIWYEPYMQVVGLVTAVFMIPASAIFTTEALAAVLR